MIFSDCPDSDATIGLNGVNALSKGTAVTVGNNVSVNTGAPATASTSYSVGADLMILSEASGYIDKITDHKVSCGKNDVEILITESTTTPEYAINFTLYVFGAEKR